MARAALCAVGLCLVAAVLSGRAAAALSGAASAQEATIAGAQSLKHHQRTQYEKAMFETMEAVKRGDIPDPRLRQPDGSPGTLLDAILPRKTESEESRRRKLAAYSWRFMGVSPSFNNGPTLAALNASFYRWDGVLPTLFGYLDWRLTRYETPVILQFGCASCWAMAAADTVAMAYAIATQTNPIVPSTQEICDCNGGSTGGVGYCCSGGWPEDAFAYMTAKGNISSNANYSYYAVDGNSCRFNYTFPIAGQITGWERVPPYNQLALLKAVNMQPVLVYINANAKDFQTYTSGTLGSLGSFSNITIYDGSCTTEVNHAVVVVGYSIWGGFWILKNTWWPKAWGDNGYMYINMVDGPGKCGMLSISPLYPVNYPNAPKQAVVASTTSSYPVATRDGGRWWKYFSLSSGVDPCGGIINPCGSGTCWNVNGIARCQCFPGYVEIIGVPTSKCVSASPCTSSMINPCGPGTCTDVGDGTYVCKCPATFAVGTRVDGAPTCIPSISNGRTYIAQYGDTCARIQSVTGISAAAFTALNPYIDCTQILVPGIVVTLSAAASVACTWQYALRAGDTCDVLAWHLTQYQFYKWLNSVTKETDLPPLSTSNLPSLATNSYFPPQNTTQLLSLNPGLNCSQLWGSQQICINSTAFPTTTAPLACGQTFTTVGGEQCSDIQQKFRLNSTMFLRLNPGLNCNWNYGTFTEGVQLCVAPVSAVNNTGTVNCTSWYSVQLGDSCARIWNAANLSSAQFLAINPSIQCQTPYLYVGQQVCIDSPLLLNMSDPNFYTYVVQPGDTWAVVQATYSRLCQGYSIAIPRIAAYNGISNWVNYTLVANTQLIIPCVQKIGSPCPCDQSNIVCGADNVNYVSYCDANCNYASPVTNSPCTACQSACVGRMGVAPNPTSACTAGYICPRPSWPPSCTAASQLFISASPQCDYRQQTCANVCTTNSLTSGSTSYSTCYNMCFGCKQVPCSSISLTTTSGSVDCPMGCSNSVYNDGCNPITRSTLCQTDCTYWNSYWNPMYPSC